MRYLSIKNLKKYQHYKDRRPPWIKLHAEVLDDYAFTCLQDASKAHLMLLWVLASRMDNRIPYDLAWITQKLGANAPIDLEELILQGFIEVSQDDSTALAPRKQSAMPETETETETEKASAPRLRGAKRPKLERPSGDSWVARLGDHWIAKVGNVKYGQVGTLKPHVELHGEEVVRLAMDLWLANQRSSGRLVRFGYFAESCAEWCAKAVTLRDAPLDDGGWMSAELELATRPGAA
jgi:hypothetical protein